MKEFFTLNILRLYHWSFRFMEAWGGNVLGFLQDIRFIVRET